MKKFFVTFSIPAASIADWVAKVSPEERAKQTTEMMESWKTWTAAHSAAILDQGLPLGKTKRVTANGIEDTKNDLTWYLIVQADSHEAAAEMFKDHPHLHIPSCYIEVMDANREMPAA